MRQTSNYQLPSWDSEDRILRTDFNSLTEKVDAALKANADALTAEASARASADSAEASARASAIAAETGARTSAVAELTAALALKGNCQVEVQTYTGTGSFGSAYYNQLTFSHKPLLLFISGTGVAFTSPAASKLWVLMNSNVNSSYGVWSDDGKTYMWYGDRAADQMNQSNTQYTAMALYAAD